MAITVYPSGVITPMPLPSLQTEHDGPARAYVRALQAVNQAGWAGKEAALARWRPALDDVCDWAWRTVVRPLLGAVPRRDGGLRRIVLVPTAELGLVPWHAARERAGDDYRYACQEAVFSYAASARQFVDTSRLEFRPWTQAPVLISDAAASSYATEIGISYLQTALYPRAAVYGRAYQRLTRGGATVVSGADAATPDNVTDSLPHRGPGRQRLGRRVDVALRRARPGAATGAQLGDPAGQPQGTGDRTRPAPDPGRWPSGRSCSGPGPGCRRRPVGWWSWPRA